MLFKEHNPPTKPPSPISPPTLHSQPYPRRTIRKGLNPAICHHPSQTHECVEMDLNNMCRFGTSASSLEWLRPDRQRRAAARKPDRLDRRGAPHGMLRSYEPGTARTGCGSRSMFPRPREACPNGLRPRWQQISSRHKLTERSSRRLCSLTITAGGHLIWGTPPPIEHPRPPLRSVAYPCLK